MSNFMNFDNSISNTLINIIFERITITENPKALFIINKNNIKIKTTVSSFLSPKIKKLENFLPLNSLLLPTLS